MPEQFTCHDLDLTAKTDNPADQTEAGWDNLLKMTTEELLSSKIAGGRRINLHDNLNWIESKKDKYWMGFNETCAYLHSVNFRIREKRFAFDLIMTIITASILKINLQDGLWSFLII